VTLSQALGLGVLQGLTEFLPISSSGHLALAQHALPGGEGPSLLFNVVVHLGTLLAIAFVLRRRLLQLAAAAVGLSRARDPSPDEAVARRWLWLIVVASVPTALLGLGAREIVEAMNARPAWVGGALLCTGAILWGSERFGRRERGDAELGVADALVVGVAQGFGVLPGISRSGVTIGAALWRGVRGDTAVELSILISIPAVLGANLLEISRAGGAALRADLAPLVCGFVAAFGAGYLSLRALQWVVMRRRLLPFAAYCGLLGAGAIALG
jgi:undecaprenyl-diphosphatase